MGLKIVHLAAILLIFSVVAGLQQDYKSTTASVRTNDNNKGRLPKGVLSNGDEAISPINSKNEGDKESDLVEIKEDEIPEGSTVYVLEEPIDTPIDGEILKTANNIVFRPLFRYRGKQEALRRNYNSRVRRRYFIPRRSYRHTYAYPYYYNSHRYY